MSKPAVLFKNYKSKTAQGLLYEGEALSFLKGIESGVADLIFIDPPFNLGKLYSKDKARIDKKPVHIYEKWLNELLQESTRVLAPGGALFIYHLPLWGTKIAAQLNGQGLCFLHWIAVSMKNGFVRGRRLYPAHYALLLYTKGKLKHFRRPRVPLTECRHCGEYIKDYGGYLPIVEKRGVNLSDIWDDLSPVRHANRKNRQANELPAAMLQRVIEIAGVKNGLFIDPFAGSGTGLIIATKAGMRFLACDLVSNNCKLIDRRLRT
jgi:site-specific DNA-methyltransferase (adenine-specific)